MLSRVRSRCGKTVGDKLLPYDLAGPEHNALSDRRFDDLVGVLQRPDEAVLAAR